MKLSHLTPVFWLAVFLVSGELLLEVRARGRGFETLLFPLSAVEATTEGPAAYGPMEGFPFRSPVIAADEPGLRLWFGSASYAEDAGLPPDVVFPNQVARLLSDMGSRTAVALNRSRAGYKADTNVDHLRREGPAWRPDVAVLYQLTNDLSELAELFPTGRGEGTQAGPALGRAPTDDADGELPSLGSFLQELYERTTVFEQMRGNVTPYLNLQRFLPDRTSATADSLFRGRVEAFVEAAREVGATPVLVTLATLSDDADAIPADLRNWSARWAPAISPEGYYATVDAWNDLIREVASARGVALIDLADALRDEPGFLRDFTHFTPDGHRRAAEIIAQGLAGLEGLVE